MLPPCPLERGQGSESAQAARVRLNRRRAIGTHTAMISTHQPIMAGTGCWSCHEPLDDVPWHTWRTAATNETAEMGKTKLKSQNYREAV